MTTTHDQAAIVDALAPLMAREQAEALAYACRPSELLTMIEDPTRELGEALTTIRHANRAMLVLRGIAMQRACTMTSPAAVRDYLTLWIGDRQSEVFGVLYLDSQHHLIEARVEFLGTINATAVHPREIVKRALANNAAGVILTHNHPSGLCEPSTADRTLTDRLRETLQAIDVRVLDHVIVTPARSYSFAENGLI